MRRATIDEVARHSGVSVATVSRAIRGLPNVSPATRRKVLESADRLRYQPDANAAALATGKPRVVAMGVMAITSWYTAQVMGGAEAELSESGLELAVTLIPDTKSERHPVDHRSIARRADGLILVDFAPEMPDPDPNFLCVVVGEQSVGFDSVAIDNAAGGRLAAEHLMQLGHRRVGVIAGSRTELSRAGSERLNGFLQVVEHYDIDAASVTKEYGNFSALGGYEAMTTMLSVAPERMPTAVFALSDDMAMGAIRAADALGYRVPEEVSVVGFDDHELSFAFGLTTVAQEPATMGAIGATFLMERLGGLTIPPRSIERSVKLVVRDSSRSWKP